MFKEFFVLDFSYENDPLPKVYIWGVTEDEKRSLLVKDNFNPYFYVIPRSEDNLKERILSLSNRNFKIVSVEALTKQYLGKDTKLLKVSCATPSAVRYYRDVISKFNNVKGIFEADIRFSMRFSIDSKIRPFTWVKADVEPMENKEFRVDHVFKVESLEPTDREDMPNLRLMGLEVSVESKYGSMNPRRDPISSICANMNGKEYKFEGDGIDDTKIIRELVSFIQKNDPDVILTYSSFEWNYIIERASFRNIKLDVSRELGEEISTGTYGHYSTPGRLNVNLSKFLYSVLGIRHAPLDDIYSYFAIQRKEGNCSLGGDLVKAVVDLGVYLSRLFGMPMDQLFSASIFSAIEWYLVRRSAELGIVIPNKHDSIARVEPKSNLIEPTVGIYEDVNAFFFNSLPSSVIESYNISPESVENGVEAKGILSSEFPSLYRKLEEESKTKFGPRISKDLTQAIGNGILDYFVWSGARWFCPQCRKNVEKLIMYDMKNKIEEMKKNGTVLYARGNVLIAKGIDEVKDAVKMRYKRVIIGEDFFIGLDENNVIDPITRSLPYGDWSEISKAIYIKVVDKLLKENIDVALRDARKEIMRVRRGEFEVSEMVIWREIEKDLNMYTQPYPLYIIAAMKANKEGSIIKRGDRIGYVVCEGVRMQDKVQPFFLVKDKKKIDKEFYVEKQIIPLLMYVLKASGIKEKDLRDSGFDISNYFRR